MTAFNAINQTQKANQHKQTRRVAPVLIAIFIAVLTMDIAHANRDLSWPIRVICEGNGQQCVSNYRFNIATSKDLTLKLSLSDTFLLRSCSFIVVSLNLNGKNYGARRLGVNNPNKPAVQPVTTVEWKVGPVGPGSYQGTLSSAGIKGGCNSGQLLRWGAILSADIDTTPATSCLDQPVPAGYVITGQVLDLGCNNEQANQLEIPFNQTRICLNSPYPSGYVTTHRVPLDSCRSSSRKGIEVIRPHFQADICADSPIPDGYVIVRHLNNTISQQRCDMSGSRTIKIPGEQETICRDSPLPFGYERVAQISTQNCRGNGDNASKIRRLR